MTDLSVQSNDISSLSGIHRLEKIKFLNASSNRLSNGMTDLSPCTSLEVLDLRDNNISAFSQLEPLKRLHNLKRLYLRSSSNSRFNAVCEEEDYKEKMLEYLPHLVSLDGEMIAFMKTSQDIELDKICKKEDLIAVSEPQTEPWFSREDLRLESSNEDEKLVLETESKIREELRLCENILRSENNTQQGSSSVVSGSSGSSSSSSSKTTNKPPGRVGSSSEKRRKRRSRK